MKCLIAGNNVKGKFISCCCAHGTHQSTEWQLYSLYVLVLARSIHSLAKMGDELHIEPSPDGLILKTVNASKSAYGDYRFHLPFFLSFSCISENTVNPNDGEELVMKCKLPMKVRIQAHSITKLQKRHNSSASKSNSFMFFLGSQYSLCFDPLAIWKSLLRHARFLYQSWRHCSSLSSNANLASLNISIFDILKQLLLM